MIHERPVRPPLRWAPVAVAVGLALVYVAWAPHTSDLAAQTARADLFRRAGFTPYWAGWFGGIPTASYSLTTPPLLGWIGPVWLGAIALVASASVAVPLLERSARPRAAAFAVTVAAAVDVVSGRATFAVGVVVGLVALLALDRSRWAAAALLAVVTTVTSPVAGVLLLPVGVGLTIADGPRRRAAVAAGAGVLLALAAIAWLTRGSGGSGFEPFTRNSMLMTVGTALVVVVTPVTARVRTVALVVIALLLAAYLVTSPVGANATRIAVLGAAPAVIAAAWPLRRWLLVLAGVAAGTLAGSQLRNDLVTAYGAPGGRAFVQPLLDRLTAAPIPGHGRLELVDAASHWPTAYLSPHVPLARGWLRQTDESRNPMFYGRSRLTAATYHAFLARNAVGAVAVPTGVPLDYGATREARLVATGLPYLHEVWHDVHWQLYAVAEATPLVSAPGTVTAYGDRTLTLRLPAAGRYAVRLRWSPYLTASGAHIAETADGDTLVTAAAAGTYRLTAAWRWP